MLRTLFTFNNVKIFINKFVLFKKQIQLRTNRKRIFDLLFSKSNYIQKTCFVIQQ